MRTWTRRDTDPCPPTLQEIRERALRKGSQQSQEHLRIERKVSSPRRVHPDMVRRMDVAPRLVNPMGMPARIMTTDGLEVISRPAHHVSEYQDLRLRAVEQPRSAQTNVEVGFGGFPAPREIISRSSRKLFPNLHRDFQRTLTIPRTATLIPRTGSVAPNLPSDRVARPVAYLSFAADVNENSYFHGLTADQMTELGGVEYRALNALLWIVPLVSERCCHNCSIMSCLAVDSTILGSWLFPS